MENEGWVAFPRHLLDSPLFASEPLWRLYTYLVMKAAHTGYWQNVTIGRAETQVLVERGTLLFGRISFAKKLGWDDNTVERRVKRIEKLGYITREPGRHYSVISIVDYDQNSRPRRDDGQPYGQPPGNQRAADGQPPGNQRAADGQPPGTNNNANNAQNARTGNKAGNGHKGEARQGAHARASWKEARADVFRVARTIQNVVNIKPENYRNDRELIIKTSYMAVVGDIPQDWVVQALKGAENASGNRAAVFHTCLKEYAKNAGKSFNGLLATKCSEIPKEVLFEGADVPEAQAAKADPEKMTSDLLYAHRPDR